jgi:hypothetical protein
MNAKGELPILSDEASNMKCEVKILGAPDSMFYA